MEKVTTQTKQLRTFTGTVVSAGMQKTATVKVDTMKLNAKYQKKYSVSKKYHVHDEKSAAKVGDVVTFVECRPLSKSKRWRLISIKQ
ncbi:MAG: 30S ribosomal protein S17 [Candidatus Magasanikbacteria bacterium]|nr:30S ribosomal protein S17 [Candidatus Magasanikbacteria bacterium]